MGFFLSSLQNEMTVFQSKAKQWSQPLQKIKEYHGIFKSVCDTFVIKREQFSQIFGNDDKLSIWQESSTINALQVFCGLGFYSSCSGFRLKLKFLFALFDFNQVKSISMVDLEYMILSILNFTYRILGRNNSRADELRLAEWLMRFVNPHKRININSLARFCHQSEEARTFLRISKNFDEDEVAKFQSQLYDQEQDMDESQRLALIAQRKQIEINTKLTWFGNFTLKLTKPKYKKEVISTCNLTWVYGIELKRFRVPFIVLSDGRILYAISSKLVIYSTSATTQRIYARHTKEVESFAVFQPAFIVASSEGQTSPKIHIWDFRNLDTQHIIRIDHSHRVHLLSFSPSGILAAVGARQQSPIVLFDSKNNFSLKASFAVEESIFMLVPFFTPLQLQSLLDTLISIFVLGGKRSIIVVDEKHSQHIMKYDSNITSIAVSYMSIEQPYRRYFTGQSLRLFVITSHQNGAIAITIFNPAFNDFDSERYEILKFQEAPKRIIITAESFLVIMHSQVRVYDLNIFLLQEDRTVDADHCRIIRASDAQHLRLLSQEFVYAAVNDHYIFLVTTEGDFLQIGDKQVQFDGILHEQETIKRLDQFVRLGGKLRALCFAEREGRGTIMVVSENKKIFEIDPESHKVSLILQIGYDDVITVIDYAISEEGPAYTVCGSQSGRLLVRIDEEEVAKVYDCQSQVTDLKISRDASYLLIATLNSVMFFQLLPSFSSPRKITFENESPVSLNFLDNPRFCSVGTSAKNIYLIEVPQLRHRNVQKDNQSFSVTKMAVDFPTRTQTVSSKLSYSRCFVGGDMKFYLLTLSTGELLYFPSMSSLQHKNYIVLLAHHCPIANVVLSQDQSLFYTIGESDSMLLEWSVREQRSQFLTKRVNEAKDQGQQGEARSLETFSRMRLVSEAGKEKEQNTQLCTFFFRGTRSDKLNRRMHDSLKLNTDNYGEEELALMKRHCRAYLKINAVYGMESNKYGQVRYLSSRTDDSRLLYSTSRFLIETEGQGSQGQRIYETATQIAYFSLSEMGEPVYAQCGHCPRIFVSGTEAVRTLHKNGLVHFTLFGEFVLSYGLQQQFFSINLHNFKTGQLIAERTTYHPIFQFLMLSPVHFVSLNQIRIWHGLIASQPLGVASSGAVLPGRKDICLGGMRGELSILSANGIFEMASNAHSKEIIAIQVNQLATSFEIITASLDQTVKIWNEYFQPMLTINLAVPGQFKVLRQMDSFGISDSNPRSQAFVVRSLDCKNRKILLAMALGQVWEYEVSSREQKVHDNQDLNSSENMSSDSNGDINDDMPMRSQRIQMNYYVERKRLLNAHCSNSVPLMQRYVAFDVHLELPLFVSAGSDGKLTFRDYLREEVLANYVCQRDESVKIRAVKFSPKGRMLVVGLTTGVLMTFFMDLSFNALKNITQVQLRYYQIFKIEEGGPYQVIALEFNEPGQMFAVSYAFDPASKRQRISDPRQSAAFIRVYKIKSEKNQNPDEAFYELRDEIRLRQQQSTSKASRCAVKIHFQNQGNKTYLFLNEEYFDNQGVRLFSTRGKHSVYCLEDKGFLSDEFSISWDKCAFPSLINLRYHDPKTDETQDNYTITAMLRWKDIIIYGGQDGKLHLLRIESLDAIQEGGECRLSQMCLSRVYSALTSPVIELLVGGCGQQRFLFVGGYGDECVVKLELIQEEPVYFLEHQPYPLETEDSLNEFLCKEHFYLTVNNRQPLREGLSNILEDVQSQPTAGLHLEFIKAFGRRAIDRRYNLTYFDQNLLYCLGPNLVVQNLKSSSQYLLKADPSPFSHCPQISAFHFNNRFLIVATQQQQRSKIYVWDIKSKSCISSMQLQCSFVLIIRFLGEDSAVYYGINGKYEPIVALVNWRTSRTLGSMRLAFSGLGAVRDLAAITPHVNELTSGVSQFVTCGYLHLCRWEMRGDSLIYHNFNSQSSGGYICVKQLNGYIITGCEEGHLYLWHQLELIHVLHNAHAAAVRCLEVDPHNELFISGGKDGLILFLKVEESKLSPFNRVQLSQVHSNSSIEEGEQLESFKIELQIQSLAPNPSLESEDQKRLLVGTRSGNVFEVRYSEPTESTKLLCEHHDNQTVVSATFSAFDRSSFFTLTNAGLIERYSLNTLSRTMPFDLGQRALKIVSCGEMLLVCCRQQVVAYRILGEQGSLEKSDSFYIDARRLEEEGKEVQITRFCLSASERLLAICIKNCSKQPTYQVSIFNLNGDVLHQLNNLKHEVDYLDFSTDDKYLLFKDRYQEIGMVSLDKDYRKINTIFVEMGIEWQQEALRLSPSAQSIYYSYSCENKITALARLGPDKLIVGDQMGTVRIFDYPCPDDKLGELHLHCYCVHMNDIAEIVVHPHLTHVLSIGLQDRSLVLWRVGQ